MSNCEKCKDRDWCSSEEMDRNECPVKFKGDFSNPFVSTGIFTKAIAILSHNWKYRELIDNSHQYEALDVAIKALKFIKHNYPSQFNYYLKEIENHD